MEKVQQVAEIVEQPVEIREYRRPLQKCPVCGWSGYSHFEGNRQFAQDVLAVLEKARTAHYHYHAGILKAEQLASKRTEVESQLQEIFQAPPEKGWPYDAKRLINLCELLSLAGRSPPGIQTI